MHVMVIRPHLGVRFPEAALHARRRADAAWATLRLFRLFDVLGGSKVIQNGRNAMRTRRQLHPVGGIVCFSAAELGPSFDYLSRTQPRLATQVAWRMTRSFYMYIFLSSCHHLIGDGTPRLTSQLHRRPHWILSLSLRQSNTDRQDIRSFRWTSQRCTVPLHSRPQPSQNATISRRSDRICHSVLDLAACEERPGI